MLEYRRGLFFGCNADLSSVLKSRTHCDEVRTRSHQEESISALLKRGSANCSRHFQLLVSTHLTQLTAFPFQSREPASAQMPLTNIVLVRQSSAGSVSFEMYESLAE